MTPTEPATNRYRAVPAQIDLPAMDHEIIAFWEANDTFAKSWRATEGGPRWNFYEGPPTANGQPGTHHIEARVFKDFFPRFKTMQGYRVDRKAGWDCHGLPVELAVEKELGIDSKSQIEEYGIERFNTRCRASVSEHVDEFVELTRRMGYWVTMDDAYWTMAPEYVDSEWWALQKIFDDGLLVQDYRVTPYCPKDETALSDHEVSQGYKDVTEPSIFVALPLTSGPWADRDARLLVWTTTPWTLVSNTAVAVHPEVTYVLATDGTQQLVLAEPLFDTVLGQTGEDGERVWTVLETVTGADMAGWDYERPYELVPFDKRANFIVLADYVTTGDGSGLVHQAPAFGADDMAVGRANDLPVINPIRPDGTFEEGLPLVGGLFFKDADPAIVADLDRRGILFRSEDHTHSYPHCWRCGTPLIYYAQPSWYIRTTQCKDELLAQNEKTTWYPDNIKWGRYGDWLRNNIDWALSRTRYWGTPLPIWRNDEDPSRLRCVGSRAELAELAGRPELAGMDPHRPFVDDVTFTLPGEPGTYRRVPEVIDAWFDSGSMSFAQWGYPWVEGSKEKFAEHFPADFICEAIDQTRGWFYTMMTVPTLVFGESSYKNVLCLGHILAEDGRKMSKHFGNILLPIPLMDRHGADAVRWFMASSGSPWSARRVGDTTLQEVVRKVMLTYWNTVAFHSLYARANDWAPTGQAPAIAGRHVLDRWLVSAVNQLVVDVTEALEAFDSQRYGTLIAAFIDELSNWYVRRSRRRFWDGDAGALWTLHETLATLTRLMAPLASFITERVWQDLFRPTLPGAPESVHLTGWPQADTALIDTGLGEAMDLARRLVEVGRSARAEAKVKTRQPLGRALVNSAAIDRLPAELVDEITAELNIERLDSFSSAGDVVVHTAKANFRALGRRYGKQTPVVAAAIAEADAAAIAAGLADGGTVTLDVTGVGPVELGADDVFITERPREGWSVADVQGDTIALDLTLTPELVSAGRAREVIRFVQDSRKAAGLDVSDRIDLAWASDDAELAAAIETHAELIAAEVLATSMHRAEAAGDWREDDDLRLQVRVTRA
ncbi:isoleucine--tRNA ligase [Propionibacterium australiense]|uniref:Isoleucine--tRNA ligase n=1 Tax=Propionibacterium australiense TaxID=119981 RepID=A0A8B3FS17_9ACTN|nr:isoleucine--tRNA ligase [Propionibacterium australiense]RLP10133.1 isoleucine--tRNA ligase [Propionibacterium australiense]